MEHVSINDLVMFYICERFLQKVEIKYRLNLLLEKWERVGESHKIVGQQNNIRQQYRTKLSESFQDDSFRLKVGLAAVVSDTTRNTLQCVHLF